MTKVHAHIPASVSDKGSPDHNAEMRRITEGYTSKVNALIEDDREEMLPDLEVQYLLDVQQAGLEPAGA